MFDQTSPIVGLPGDMELGERTMNFTSLQNYYEPLVFDIICDELVGLYKDCNEEFFQDVACYALGRLPARYIRYTIDMAFFLSAEERKEMQALAREAVFVSAQYIYNRRDRA